MGLWRNSSADDDDLITKEDKLSLQKKKRDRKVAEKTSDSNSSEEKDVSGSEHHLSGSEHEDNGATKSTVVRRRRLIKGVSIDEERAEVESEIEKTKTQLEDLTYGADIDEEPTLEENTAAKTPIKDKLKKKARSVKR